VDLKKYKALKDRLSQLSVQFGQNLNNDVSTVAFSEAELKGAKADFLARLKKDTAGNYIATTKAPDYLAVMENVVIAETRKKMMFAYNNRQAEANTAILQEATKLRADIGKLMGYPTYADYALREKMAGNSKAVFDFLNGLKDKLAAKNKSDLKTLAQFKAQVLKDKSPLEIWDVPYLTNLLKIQKYNVDQEVVRQYFPAQYVVDQTLDVYSQLLGVNFRQIKGAPVWAEQVELYEVTDRASKQVVAYFYADLIPREGKYGHAAAFPLISGRNLIYEDGSYQKPVASIVANFTPAAPGKPVLLSHNEVETFFHEFGHIMHQVLTKAKFGSLSGSNVKGDFVEAPSQMLENWVWQKEILKKMSQNYQDPKKKLPDDLIARLQKIKMFNSGVQYTRQLVFGLFDMNIHTHPNLDITQEYADVHLELTGLKALEGTHFPATFGHMMGGYSAGYYGYLWSKVFAEDMFSVFLAKGILNPKVGMKYRTQILESGNMRDPMDLIKGFLGREPNNKAFFKSLGL
jgi:Zn-dependent oligopeptidase